MTDAARQYALAVFSLAFEKDLVKKLQDQFLSFIEGFNQESKSFFLHPGFHKQEKKNILDKLDLIPLFRDFLFVLIDNDRFDLLDDVSVAYDDLVTNQNNILNVQIYSKILLTAQQKDRITQKLERDYNRTVHLEEFIDESIIAGYKLTFDGYTLDDTIQRRLSDLKTNLKRN